MGLLSCLCSMLFPTYLQPFTSLFSIVIIFLILVCVASAFKLFLLYLIFVVTRPWRPKFKSATYDTHKNKKVHLADDVSNLTFNDENCIDLRDTTHGEQLFINGYLQGYRDGKSGKRPVYTQSDSWKEAGEEALEHIRQSFVHDEEDLRRAMLG